jgi:phenylalanyl-tRNA synthetase alpha chain
MWNFSEIRQVIESESKSITDSQTLEAFRIKYLGKKGLLSQMYAAMGTVSAEEKPILGKNANELRNKLNEIIQELSSGVLAKAKSASAATLDVSLPGVYGPIGHTHLLTQIGDEICGLWEQLGFVVQEGPEIETEFNNFTALNIPVDHPSRDAFDTFYLHETDPDQKGRHLLLRSHTSPGQIRIMQKNKPPLAVIIPGKVYRPDAVDASHSFMFHQIEGLLVDENIKFSDLKGMLGIFLRRLFGENIKMRFRPHFFPFTEPSAEVDISWDKGKRGWLEIMGCGMVHPKVFESCGYSKGKYTGFAFGMGVERMAMLKYGIDDIRLFYENDKRFLQQF